MPLTPSPTPGSVRRIVARLGAVTVVLITGCSPQPTVEMPNAPTDRPVAASAPGPAVRVDGTVATGLDVPWGIAFLPDGTALVSERDSARILLLDEDQTRLAGTVDDAVPAGEGGLLGIAYDDGWVYAYYTAEQDNRVVRMSWDGGTLGDAEPVFTGIPKAGIHNGGRILFGPDGMLYIATGDAANPDSAQDPSSPAGKILRIRPDGGIPQDNPKPGSPVFSLGHRNVQGLAFDDRGRLWASEFGQVDVDELNLITAGSNYGWPDCEGSCARAPFTDPVVQWSPTSIASPSGIAISGDYAYVASLRGQTVWQVPLKGSGEATRLDLGDLGRLRTLKAAPDGSLWLSTSNTDGRGDPRDGDDRILRLTLP